MNPLVSIIVPIYRIKEKYLYACIDSLVGQTYKNIEVLLVDDGSPDNCGAICDSYAEKYPFVHVIHQKNQGVSVARNHGIECSVGEYIVFVDADDWIEADCVEIVVKEIERQKVDVLFFQHIKEDDIHSTFLTGKSRLIEKSEVKNIHAHLLKAESFYNNIDFKPPWGKIIKTSLLENNVIRFPVGLKKAQDVIFNLYLCEYMKSAYYLNYLGYHYRINSESINHRYNPEMPRIMIRVLEEAEKFVEQYHNEDIDYKKALGVRAISQGGSIEHTYTLHEKSRLSLDEIRSVTKNYLHNENVGKYIMLCSIGDFTTLKRKIRYLLFRQKSLFLYSCFCRLRRMQIQFFMK
ncbi:MAG: glycosyltransferase [Clostridiales bacterium]|nr:glycosyltransferase [Clostridiales bacterium]